MKLSFIEKVKKELYKSFIIFMVWISMSTNPVISNEIKKMLDHLNEAGQEQQQESEIDEEQGEQEETYENQ